MPELRNLFWTLFVFLAIIATTCLATSTIGLLCSALSRRTSVALVLTYMTLLVLFVGPVGMGWYLQGFASISEERLAALTLSSPLLGRIQHPDAPAPGQRTLGEATGEQDPQALLPIPTWA